MNFNDWNLNRGDIKFLIIVAIFSIGLTLKMLSYHMSGGIYSPDKCIYLINALNYAGLDVNNIVYPENMFYTPVTCFLTSILFRFGLVDKLAIFLVSVILGFSGNIALYILLRNRFNPVLSLFGSILYGSFSVFLFNISSGLIDVPSVTISIWILVFTTIAVKNNEKYFTIIFPLWVFGFFTRFTVGFILPVIILYYLINKNLVKDFEEILADRSLFKDKFLGYIKSSEFKYILLSCIIALVMFCLFCKLILDYGATLSFFEQSSNTFSNAPSPILDKWYYIKNFPVILFEERQRFNTTLAYLVYSIIILGLAVKIVDFVKNFNNIKESKLEYRNNSLKYILIILFIISILGFIIGFKFYANNMMANISLLIALFALFSFIPQFQSNKKFYSFNFLIFAWFSTYFVFVSLYGVQIPRYAIPLLPPFACFAVYGLENILIIVNKIFDNSKSLDFKYTDDFDTNYEFSKKTNLLPVLLIVLFVISTVMFVGPMEIEGFPDGLVDVSDYIMEHDPDYYSKNISCYDQHFQIIRWYLQKNINPIPNEEIDTVDSTDVDYMITNRNISYKNYHQIFDSKTIYLYAHN